MTAWTRTKDQQPPIGLFVLIWNANDTEQRFVRVAKLMRKGVWSGAIGAIKTPTHWRHMPAPPGENE